MKRYIDLFKQQEKQNKYIVKLQKAKKTGIILLIVLFVATLIEGGLYLYISKEINDDRVALKRYNTFIIQNKVFDSKIHYFAYKYGLLKQYILKDANVTYYYGLLDTFLGETNSQAYISDFSLNNERFVQYSLTFPTYENAIDFMASVESERMADFFDELQLIEFTLDNRSTDSYILKFEGTFKKITDAANT